MPRKIQIRIPLVQQREDSYILPYRNLSPLIKTITVSKAFLPDGIERFPITKWTNGHQNFTHTFTKDASFKLFLPNAGNSSSKYRATTSNFMWLINYAIEHKLQLRAMGNGWSFSEVAVCNGGMVDTKALRLSFAFKDSFVAQEYLSSGKSSSDLFLAQCGMSILSIHEKLHAAGRSLKASGASNGQSIAGATATGTHGAAYKVGAVHDSIIGLHIVTGPDSHVWLERSSNPVASDEMIQWLGAKKISDDDMFNAAVVSFGNFGFIHGVLLETEPIFLLEEHKLGEAVYDDKFKAAMNETDLRHIAHLLPHPLDDPDKELYHFEVLVNPHDFEEGNPSKGVFPKFIYKIPYTQHYTPKPEDSKPFVYGDNTLGLMQTILDTLGPTISAPLIPRLVNAMLPLAFQPGPPVLGTIGEIFRNTRFRGKAASAAFAINSKDCSRVLEIILAINNSKPFAGAIAFRFVKGTPALLGFTRFPKTSVVEMDGVESGLSRNFFKAVWDKLEAEGIPFTLHWGKINFFLTADRIKNMYGETTVNKWKACRNALLTPEVRKVFSNDFMKQLQLDN